MRPVTQRFQLPEGWEAGAGTPIALGAASLALASMALTMAFSSIGLLLRLPMALGGGALVAFAISLAIGLKLFPWDKRLTAASALLFVCATAGCCAVATQFLDASWDGNYYHKAAVAALREGWNPVYASLADWPSFTAIHPEGSAGHRSIVLWCDHYAQGLWEIEAIIYGITGCIEAAKAPTLIIAGAAAALVGGYGRIKGLRAWQGWVLGLSAGANPIVIAQCTSFYCDAFLMMALLGLLVGLTMLADGEKPFLRQLACLIIASSFLLCAGTKLTGLLYACVFGLAFFALYAWRAWHGRKGFDWGRIRRIWLFFCGVLLFSVLVVGFSPYVTNMLDHGHLAYPLMGEGAVDIMTGNTPRMLDGRSNGAKLAISLFSETSSPLSADVLGPELKPPFAVTDKEVADLAKTAVDARFGGFGVLTSGIFLLSAGGLVVMLVVSWRRNRSFFQVALCLLIPSLALSLALGESWWARYSFYLYYMPLLVLYFLFWWSGAVSGGLQRASASALALLLFGVMMANIGYYVRYSLAPLYRSSAEAAALVDAFAEASQEGCRVYVSPKSSGVLGMVYTLSDHGVDYELRSGSDELGGKADGSVRFLDYRIERQGEDRGEASAS